MRIQSRTKLKAFSGVIATAVFVTAVDFVHAENVTSSASRQSQSRVENATHRANARPVGKMPGRSRYKASQRSSDIQLTQHQSRRNRGNVRQASEEKEKKPSLFKRLFSFGRDDNKEASTNGTQTQQSPSKGQGESAGSDDNPYINSGQAVPQLPPPPPISYQTNNHSTYNSRGVPAKPAGYNSNQATPMIRQSPGSKSGQRQTGDNRQNDGLPTLNTPDKRGYQSAPYQQQAPRHDGFVDPFDQSSDGELLDLDSIARDPRGVAEVTEIPANPVRIPIKPAEELLPELPVQTEVVSQEPPRGPANGPYTGYLLDTDEQLLVEPKLEQTSSSTTANDGQGTSSPSRESAAEVTPDITLPLIEDEVTEPELPLTPTKEPEAATALAPVTTPEQDSVPLLDESEMDFPSHDELEQDFQQLDEREDSTEEPQLQSIEEGSAISEPELPGADRIRALDTRAKQDQQRFRIMARSGKFGFKGFCPVVLRDSRELIDSRERYKAKFGLQTYYFSSPEAKTAFEANPARYAPAAGGSDVVLLVNTGEDTAGSLDFSLWYRDRLYMFRSRETQAIFAKDPTRFADQY